MYTSVSKINKTIGDQVNNMNRNAWPKNNSIKTTSISK